MKKIIDWDIYSVLKNHGRYGKITHKQYCSRKKKYLERMGKEKFIIQYLTNRFVCNVGGYYGPADFCGLFKVQEGKKGKE